MSETLVTGIAPASDAQQIETMLGVGEKLEAAHLSIISKATHSTQAGGDQHGSGVTASSTIMTGSSGTGVPGIGRGHASLSQFSGHAGFLDYLGGLPLIPPDQAQNYNVAIAEGRSLVTYKTTPEEAPQIEQLFRQAGLRNVKSFKSR